MSWFCARRYEIWSLHIGEDKAERGLSGPTFFNDEKDNNTSETDVASWCYKWTDGKGWDSKLGWSKYRAPNNNDTMF